MAKRKSAAAVRAPTPSFSHCARRYGRAVSIGLTIFVLTARMLSQPESAPPASADLSASARRMGRSTSRSSDGAPSAATKFHRVEVVDQAEYNIAAGLLDDHRKAVTEAQQLVDDGNGDHAVEVLRNHLAVIEQSSAVAVKLGSPCETVDDDPCSHVPTAVGLVCETLNTLAITLTDYAKRDDDAIHVLQRAAIECPHRSKERVDALANLRLLQKERVVGKPAGDFTVERHWSTYSVPP